MALFVHQQQKQNKSPSFLTLVRLCFVIVQYLDTFADKFEFDIAKFLRRPTDSSKT